MDKVKHGLALIVFSLIALLFLAQLALFFHGLGAGHAWLTRLLGRVFFFPLPDSLEKLMIPALALVLIPLVVALVPAFIYWVIRRKEMPYFIPCLWLVWVMLVTAVALR